MSGRNGTTGNRVIREGPRVQIPSSPLIISVGRPCLQTADTTPRQGAGLDLHLVWLVPYLIRLCLLRSRRGMA